MSFLKRRRDPSTELRILWMGVTLLLIVAIALHLYATWEWGVGVSHDSIFYISAAEHFLEGKGISRIGAGNEAKPLTHFPPLYPMILSLLGSLIGVRVAVDWGAAILFGVNTALITYVIYLGTKSKTTSFLGGVLALLSPILLDIHFEAMSEPLYVASTLVSFILLVFYLRERKYWRLFLAALAASLAYLTRYIGISVVLTGALSLLLLDPVSYMEKIKRTSLYGSVSLLPNLIWFLRNYHLTGSLTNRVLSFHPVTKKKLSEGVLSISNWVLAESSHDGFKLSVVVIIFFVILAGLVMNRRRQEKKIVRGGETESSSIFTVLMIHGCIYVILLFLSLTFFDISTRLNNRILLPLYSVVLVLAFISAHRIMDLIRPSLKKILIFVWAFCFATVSVVYALRSYELVNQTRQDGRGFTSAAWQGSEIIAILRSLKSDAIVYSNEAFAIYYLTDIGAYGIPEKLDPVKAEIRDDFESLMEKMRERLSNPDSALVVFHQGYLRAGMPTLVEIAEGFVIAHESRDGVILVDPRNIGLWKDG